MSDKTVEPLLYVVSDIESKVAVAPVHLTKDQTFMVTMRAFRDAVDPRDQLLREISNWLVCEPIATPEDMAQSFTPFREAIDKLLGVDEAVPAAPPKPFSPEEGVVLKEVAQGLAQSAEKTVQEWMGIVYQLKNTAVGNVWRDASKEQYECAEDMQAIERRVLYAAPDQQYRELALQLLDGQEKLKEARKLLMDALDDMEYGDGQSRSAMYWRLRKYRDEKQPGRQDVARGRAEEPIIFTKAHTVFGKRHDKLELYFDPADGQTIWLFHSQDNEGEVDESLIPIDSIENAESVATFLMSWVYAERARRAAGPKFGACGQGSRACNEGGGHYVESGNGADE